MCVCSPLSSGISGRRGGETPPPINVATSSRRRLDLLFLSYTPLCLDTPDFPQSLYVLTGFKALIESRLLHPPSYPPVPQTPSTCLPPSQKFLSRVLHKVRLKNECLISWFDDHIEKFLKVQILLLYTESGLTIQIPTKQKERNSEKRNASQSQHCSLSILESR